MNTFKFAQAVLVSKSTPEKSQLKSTKSKFMLTDNNHQKNYIIKYLTINIGTQHSRAHTFVSYSMMLKYEGHLTKPSLSPQSVAAEMEKNVGATATFSKVIVLFTAASACCDAEPFCLITTERRTFSAARRVTKAASITF